MPTSAQAGASRGSSAQPVCRQAASAQAGDEGPTSPAAEVRAGCPLAGTSGAGAEELTSRQAAKLARREAIVQAAKGLFAAHGFAAVSIEQVGKGAGVSGPAVYRHFASKEALLGELLVGISQRLDARGAQIAAAAVEPHAALAELIDFHVHFATTEPELIRIQDRDFSSLPEDARRQVRRLQRSYVALWVGIVRAAHPELDEAAATVRVHALFGMINSTHYVVGRQPVRIIEEQLRLAARAALQI